ncbi:MAG: FkbM family methyltransferase [Verrucomicrobia bacterium]|nr:FkbM family methyltransferase [Verrucomicrobiota bacterium]
MEYDLNNSLTFYPHLIERLLSNAYELQSDNTDVHRFPYRVNGRRDLLWNKIKSKLFQAARRQGFVYIHPAEPEKVVQHLREVAAHGAGFESFYRLLGDKDSQEMLVAVIAYRIMGADRIKLPTNDAPYWNAIQQIQKELLLHEKTLAVPVFDGFLNLYDLDSAGYPIRLHAHLLNVLNTFVLEQYRYSAGDRTVAVERGDIVIDGGGCWGDTALQFAHRSGDEGKIYCFEFDPENLAILRRNLELNPALRNRIRVMEEALWSRSGETVKYSPQGPGTSLLQDGTTTASIATRSIDDLVHAEKIPRVDFIKMDIEGAEMNALQGAAETIRRFHPKLAIALYHRLEDFTKIPQFIQSLDVPYKFYLDHFTIHQEETVLFACPEE